MSQDKILGNRYKVGKVIGHGGFSVVYECTEMETGQRYAVKVLNKEKVRHADMEEAFERECMALRRMHNCPYITNAREILQSTRNYYIVMDLADRGSLLQRIVKTNNGCGLNPAAVRRYFTQLLQGVRDMHSVEIVHRDIKPENLLLDERMRLRISDFGFAARASTSRILKRQCGTPQYVAPEVIRGNGYIGQYADIWSCGVTFYVLLCGQLPFVAPDNERLYDRILEGKYPPPRGGEGLPEVPPAALHLLSCCLSMTPEKRWSAEHMLKHPYLLGSNDIILEHPLKTELSGLLSLNGSFCVCQTPLELASAVEACELRPTKSLMAPSVSCPNLSDIPLLDIDIWNDPELGRARPRHSRIGSMGRQYESSDFMMESTPDDDECHREGLGSRNVLRFVKHTSYTDDPGVPRPFSQTNLSSLSDNQTPVFVPLSQSDSGTPVDAVQHSPPPRTASRQRATPASSPSLVPGSEMEIRFAKPLPKRFGMTHVIMFFNFIVVCLVVLVVGILKVLFDIKLNRIPLPRAVREMAASLIDEVGLGDAATPAPVSSDAETVEAKSVTPGIAKQKKD